MHLSVHLLLIKQLHAPYDHLQSVELNQVFSPLRANLPGNSMIPSDLMDVHP